MRKMTPRTEFHCRLAEEKRERWSYNSSDPAQSKVHSHNAKSILSVLKAWISDEIRQMARDECK